MHTGNMRGRRFFTPLFYSLAILTIALVLTLGLSGCGERASAEGPEGAGSTAEVPESGSVRSSEETAAEEEPFDIAVFIPGVLAGSPLYQMLADGVTQAVDAHEQATVKVVEGGFNQAEWRDKVTELAAAGKYELIISSNPALPEICDRVSKNFPRQKFLLFDGYLEGNDSIYTFRYNQYEQAFLAGHMAGLVTTNGMPGANPDLKIGLIAGQEYPDMNQAIKPGFLAGARMVNDDISLDFRVVGNWYDATKAAELAQSMVKSGVDVILPIAGGANQGVIKTAEESDTYIHWFDTNGYANSPGRIIGSTALLQEQAAREITAKAIEGSLQYGEAEVVGVADGWVTFISSDPLYTDAVPEELRMRQKGLLEKMVSGDIRFEMPR